MDDMEVLVSLTNGLSNDELDALIRTVPKLRHACSILQRGPVPLGMEHGDMWPAQVLVGEEGPCLIDWLDAAITHPALLFRNIISPGMHPRREANGANPFYLRKVIQLFSDG
jgi:hypothetical protein